MIYHLCTTSSIINNYFNHKTNQNFFPIKKKQNYSKHVKKIFFFNSFLNNSDFFVGQKHFFI